MFGQVLFSGLALGSIYGLVALGFAVVFKATDVFNFAQGMFVVCGAFFAVTALSVLSPETRLRTAVVEGLEAGQIVLVGGGDATLTRVPVEDGQLPAGQSAELKVADIVSRERSPNSLMPEGFESLGAEGLRMSWGILFRNEVLLNYARIQDIHLRSNAIERALGLARIEIQTASGSSSSVMTLEGLADPEIQTLVLALHDAAERAVQQRHPGPIGAQPRPTATTQRQHNGIRLRLHRAMRGFKFKMRAFNIVRAPPCPAVAHMKLHARPLRRMTQAMQPGAQQRRCLHVGWEDATGAADEGVDAEALRPVAQLVRTKGFEHRLQQHGAAPDAAGAAQHPFAEPLDQAGFLGDRDEHGG